VPVNVVFSDATSVSPELIVFEVVVRPVAITRDGDEQPPPFMEPYPTPLRSSFALVASVRLNVTLTPPDAEAKKNTEVRLATGI
jgi:hypothetical protein